MLFEHLLEDRLSFVGRLLRSKEKKTVKGKPFQSIQSVDGEFGFIALLEGRDTPRAVRTWMYSPKRQRLNSGRMVATSVPMDLHIYMDALKTLTDPEPQVEGNPEKQTAEQLRQGKPPNTHRIHILKASHFLNAKGFYDYELIFWQDLALALAKGSPLTQQWYAETLAIKLTDFLAHRCLDIPSPLKLQKEEWKAVLDELMTPVYAKQKSMANPSS